LWLAQTFVQVADTLVDDFDRSRFASTFAACCAELLGGDAAVALALSDDAGELHVHGVSSLRPEIRDLCEMHSREGPGADAFRTGDPIIGQPLDASKRLWPSFVRMAQELGFKVAHEIPMRLRTETIGVVSILQNQDDAASRADLELVRALVDAATIALLQQRRLRRTLDLAQQLQEALESRVPIEQAKGIVSIRVDGDMQAAFELLRRYARSHNQPLARVATDVVTGAVSALDLQEFDRGHS